MMGGLNYNLKKALQSHELYVFDPDFSSLVLDFLSNGKVSDAEVELLLKKVFK